MNVSVLERIVFTAGETVFREGDEGNRAYIVQEGLVEIVKVSDGEEIVLGTVEKGGEGPRCSSPWGPHGPGDSGDSLP